MMRRLIRCRSHSSLYTFCIDKDGKIFEAVLSLLKQTLQQPLPEDIRMYILLACLRILKVNLHEVINRDHTPKDLGLGTKFH